ncbi:MAG: hypothetical protein KAS32_08110 [Candidatus Peribacteraceae bacterium]|nr:hypothetical protein [Candidatus Peribacteraceae bacterium]
MITNLVFSKNRASQLNTLICSLNEYSGVCFNNKVIYATTDESFERGYDILRDMHSEIEWIEQTALKPDILENMNSDYTSFMVDDLIMFKTMPQIPHLEAYQCFSLRLGKNVREPHLSYPLSLDGHVFRTEDIKPLIEAIKFHNPNKLESRLQQFKDSWEVLYDYQAMVGIPHNRVSTKSGCAFSGLYSAELLNKYFIEGYEIDYNKMDFSNLTNVHSPIDYCFKLREC